ncbi:maleylpyruvate isomerase family mycothiol-dependent enzyme [Nonomuraea sp. SBT364]|uniref:maleylpyruvate isomerase family mycothiol-dependent enzyme n=1 Tax=Nonomuraea sp. SBT364 TaxID=1580530 RepID=UPI00066D06CC|nr:maleylpyruvate isomerase family mycothiol-dependent enzyme [Nonomuraea sp. SBT364]
MRTAELLQHLRRESAAFRACLDGDLSAPVEHCGDWTLYDLADHLGGGNLWAATAVTERHGRHEAPPAPRDGLGAWFDQTTETLLKALDGDPAAEAWTFHPPHTVGFWQRRRPLETVIHRWDAEHALGLTPSIDPGLAGEGVAEVFDTMASRMIKRGLAQPPAYAIRVRASDTGQTWTYGPGEPVAEIAGRVEELLLMLWGRLPRSHPGLRWEGDAAAGLAMLDGPLTP